MSGIVWVHAVGTIIACQIAPFEKCAAYIDYRHTFLHRYFEHFEIVLFVPILNVIDIVADELHDFRAVEPFAHIIEKESAVDWR